MVIAAITVPAVLNSLQNQEFKVGYKKAFSDLSQAAAEGVAFGEFPYRDVKRSNEIALEEWTIIKNKFGTTKVCENNVGTNDCWIDADRICTGSCGGGGMLTGKTFIDLQGRAWMLYIRSENIYLVDTNGDKGPNQFGKERWIFTFAEGNGKRICDGGDFTNCNNPGTPKKIIPYLTDIKTKHSWCQHPACYYKSWLIN